MARDFFDDEKAMNDDEEYRELFWKTVRSYPVETIDTNVPADEVCSQIADGVLKGKFKTVSVIKDTLLKSLVMDGKFEQDKSLLNYVSFANFKLKKVTENEFYINYLKKNVPENRHIMGTSAEVLKMVLADIVVDKLQDTYGDVVFLEEFKSNCEIKYWVDVMLKNAGFEVYDKNHTYLVLREPTARKGYAHDQGFALEKYQTVVETFIASENYHKFTPKWTKKEEFENFWAEIERMLDGIDERLTPETKKTVAYQEAHKIASDFFEIHKIHYKDSRLKDGVRGEFYTRVHDICYGNDYTRLSAADESIMVRFYRKIVKLFPALNYSDEENNHYPVNYFKIMAEDKKVCSVNELCPLLTKFRNIAPKMNLPIDIDLNLLDDTKTIVRKCFKDIAFTSGKDCNGSMVIDPKEIGKTYDGWKYFKNNTKVNLQDREALQDFINKGMEIIRNEDLPETKMCADLVYSSLAKGKYPIRIPGSKSLSAEIELNK